MIPGGRDSKIFTGVMDKDTEGRYLGAGNYRNLLNARSSINSEGSFGAIEDVMGNVLVNNPYLTNGRNKVIGSYEDIAGQSCIFFVWNEFGYHGIYRWYANRVGFPNGVIEKIYQVADPSSYDQFNPNPLNFQENSLIVGVNLVENILCWTDSYNQPKTIDIYKANTNKPTSLKICLQYVLPEFNTTYTINFRSTTNPVINGSVTIVNFTVGNLSIQNRCSVIANQINATQGAVLTATNRNTFVEVTTNANDDLYILIEELNGPQLNKFPALAFNTYPLYRTDPNPDYSQPDLKQWHTNLIKTPPRCTVTAEYSDAFNAIDPVLFANVAPTILNYSSSTAFFYLGSNNDSTPPFYDLGNQYVIGPTFVSNFQGLTPSSVPPVTTYFGPNQDRLLQANLNLNLNITIPSAFNTSWRVHFRMLDNSPGNQPIGTYFSSYYPCNGLSQNVLINNSWSFQALLGTAYWLQIFIEFIDTSTGTSVSAPAGVKTLQIAGGNYRLNGAANNSTIDLFQPYVFRAKYNFWNNENSVYSAISNTAKPITYQERSINITFDDVYISDYTYASLIKNIVLAYSPDDGTTWYDFKILNQDYFFRNKQYVFFGNEVIAEVPTAVSIKPYHAVPLKSKAQEYIDNRIFFGGILEGYDLHTIDISLGVQYINIQDSSLYPNNNVFSNALLFENYGAFWERGYQGYVGIVYYDDYDRKSFVNICPNSYLYTKFWSENQAGLSTGGSAAIVNWSVNNEPPIWATKYRFVRTKNIRTENYLEWTPTYTYEDGDGNIIPYTNFAKLVITAIGGTTPYPRIFSFTIDSGSGPVSVLPSNYSVVATDINAAALNISGAINAFGSFVANAINNVVYIQTPPNSFGSISASFGTPFLLYLLQSNSTATVVNMDFSSLADYNTAMGAKLSFTFVEGDYVTFKISNGYVQSKIKSVVGNIVSINPNTSFYPPDGPVQLFSQSPNTDKFYYEFGDCYDIYTLEVSPGVFKRYHKGQTQDQTNTQPALGVWGYGYGNAWYRNEYSINPLWDASFGGSLCQRQTFSDFTEQTSSNNGRPNIISEIGQLNRISTIRFSNIYVSNTEINGINDFELLNVNQYNIEYGLINKLQVINNDVLKLVFGNSYQLSIYVSQGVIRQTQGAGNLISLSDEVAGNSHIIQRTLGTINGECVVVNDEGDMFGYDENEGVVWVSSGNGLIQVSDRGMKSIFKRYSNERKATGGISEVPSVYDLYHDEYIITLGSMDGFVGVTIAYNKQKQGWTSYYSFVPEYYGRVRDYIVSFKDGELWAHDRNVLAKNFYGVQYNRELTYVSNKDFPKVKDFKAISINGIGLNDVPTIRILPFQGYLSGMLSSLSKRFFKVLEGIQYAHFQKDKLSPGFGGNQLQALANGRNLKGQVIEVTLVNDDTAKSSIYSSDIVYFYSEHS